MTLTTYFLIAAGTLIATYGIYRLAWPLTSTARFEERELSRAPRITALPR
jgi:hypothetical protein